MGLKLQLRRAAYRLSGGFAPDAVTILTASPRSGTTWMAEVLAAISAMAVVNEPFNTGLQDLHERGFTPRTFKPADSNWPEGVEYIEGLLDGRLLDPVCLVDTNVPVILRADRVLLKCVRINRLLPWLMGNFNFADYIVVYRHPCAVIASQLQHEHFPAYARVQDFDLELIDDRFPDLSVWVRDVNDEVKARAVNWALDQVIPLSVTEGATHFMYEDLVTHGEQLLGGYTAARGDTFTGDRDLAAILRQPSRESQAWSADHADMDRALYGWNERLSTAQVDAVFEVIERFGISGYQPDGSWQMLKKVGP